MRLSRRIADADLPDPVARTFAAGLREVAAADGFVNDVEERLIGRLIDGGLDGEAAAAPFEALWSCAELFLTACITVAVSDGPYGVEEARLISLFAHRLGYSVRRLSELESRVFAELNERALAAEAEAEAPTVPRRRPLLSSSENTTAWLRDSDSELIQHFRKQREES
ncbi:MAG: hypothetical protein ACI8S6_001897 [Myxococcota bacterium]|jgi:hypothetical protein